MPKLLLPVTVTATGVALAYYLKNRKSPLSIEPNHPCFRPRSSLNYPCFKNPALRYNSRDIDDDIDDQVDDDDDQGQDAFDPHHILNLDDMSSRAQALAALPPAVVQLWEACAKLYDLKIKADPLAATMIGDYRYNHLLADLSRSALDNILNELIQLQNHVLNHIDRNQIATLAGEEELQNYAFLLEMLRLEIKARQTFMCYELPTGNLFGPHLLLPQAAAFHPWRDVADTATFIQRLRAFRKQSTQIIQAFRSAIVANQNFVANNSSTCIITLPVHAVQAIIVQCEQQVVEQVEDSPIYLMAVTRIEAAGGSVELLERVLWDDVIPAYKKLATFLKEEYLRAARRQAGIGGLRTAALIKNKFKDVPGNTRSMFSVNATNRRHINGSASSNPSNLNQFSSRAPVPDIEAMGDLTMYKGAIEYFTSLQLDPAQIHQIGLEEVERIHSEMRKVRASLGDDVTNASLCDFVAKMKNNPELFAKDPEDILTRYRTLLTTIETKLPTFFANIPNIPLDIKPVEAFREANAPAAHYYPAPESQAPTAASHSAFAPPPATFYANTSKANTRPIYLMEAFALHEGVPGHHLQISLAKLIKAPRIRKQTQPFCIGYSEGWGLYAEYLGEVMGLYDDPRNYFGRLITEVWRAARLVIDTGIHAFGWTREQAAEYLRESVALPQSDIDTEVDRITVLPGQALAYKLGELEITHLKDKALEILGSKFSWQSFHDIILKHGALPLLILRQNVHQWIEEEKFRD